MGVERCVGKGFDKAICEAFAEQCDAQDGKDGFSLTTENGQMLAAGATLDDCYLRSRSAAKGGRKPAVDGAPAKREPEKMDAPVAKPKVQEIKECKGVDASKIFQAPETCRQALMKALGVQAEAPACPLSVKVEETTPDKKQQAPVKKQKEADALAQTNGGAAKPLSREAFVIPVSLEADPLEVEVLKGGKVRVTFGDLDQVEMPKGPFDELNAEGERIVAEYDAKIYEAYLAWHAAPVAPDGTGETSLKVATSDGQRIDLQAKNAASAAAVKEIDRLIDERDRKYSIARKRMARKIKAMSE